MNLYDNIQYLKGVGPNRIQMFNKIGIKSIKDLIEYFPREYEDRSKIKEISNFVDAEFTTFKATVILKLQTSYVRKGLVIHKTAVKDKSGICNVMWFNQNYITKLIIPNETYLFYGRVNKKDNKIEVENPLVIPLNQIDKLIGIIPIYPLTTSLHQGNIRNTVKLVLDQLHFDEILDDSLREKYKLCEYNFAINQVHFPSKLENISVARNRLIFEELLIFYLALSMVKNNIITEKGICFSKKINTDDFLRLLPFELTNAQKRVTKEIESDMISEKVMNRLVQGDVGSGKTIVAAIAMFRAVKSGYQAVMMAPTTILATQHYIELKKIFDKINISTEIITSSTTKKQKETIINRLKTGEIDILFGTHAVIEDKIEFKKLGLVITDEQHRFGVDQRIKLSSKGFSPDIIVMTATPIPRTLALIIYGDLDISIIDELPAGRKIIKTYAVTDDMDQRINEFIKKEIRVGRQVYIVCPLVEESDDEKLQLKAVKKLADHYINDVFREFKVSFIYGKMKNKEKNQIMDNFKNNDINILISTTVIEVGVNVPNASIMVIENSERFGLAQLHQLRGRVGRGEYQSYCVLKYGLKSEQIRERLSIMEKSNNGFEIAEKDLELRGPGDFFGIRQHGLPEFKIANLLRDVKVLKEVQDLSKKIIEEDRHLTSLKYSKLRQKIINKFGEKISIIGT